MKANIRKIVYRNGAYRVLKPKGDSKWHRYGKRKSLKDISNLMWNLEFDLEMSEEIRREIEQYRAKEGERREEYSEEKNFHQK